MKERIFNRKSLEIPETERLPVSITLDTSQLIGVGEGKEISIMQLLHNAFLCGKISKYEEQYEDLLNEHKQLRCKYEELLTGKKPPRDIQSLNKSQLKIYNFIKENPLPRSKLILLLIEHQFKRAQAYNCLKTLLKFGLISEETGVLKIVNQGGEG